MEDCLDIGNPTLTVDGTIPWVWGPELNEMEKGNCLCVGTRK